MRTALIIGASGGIGRAVSSALAARGVSVTGLSRGADGLDVTDAVSVDRVMARQTGPYDLILIATGILAPAGEEPEKSLSRIKAAAMAEVMAAIGSLRSSSVPHPERIYCRVQAELARSKVQLLRGPPSSRPVHGFAPAVEVVGGATRVGIVKKTLATACKLNTDGSLPNFGLKTTMNADEPVARGTALQCA